MTNVGWKGARRQTPAPDRRTRIAKFALVYGFLANAFVTLGVMGFWGEKPGKSGVYERTPYELLGMCGLVVALTALTVWALYYGRFEPQTRQGGIAFCLLPGIFVVLWAWRFLDTLGWL